MILSAGALFSKGQTENRLHYTDAMYVEVLHTNAFMLGYADPMGHADFYPNYGTEQPGCILDFIGQCAHGRAVEYFAESVNSTGFIARRCESFNHIINENCWDQDPQISHTMQPIPSNHNRKGIFYFRTNSRPKYALGYKVKGF